MHFVSENHAEVMDPESVGAMVVVVDWSTTTVASSCVAVDIAVGSGRHVNRARVGPMHSYK